MRECCECEPTPSVGLATESITLHSTECIPSLFLVLYHWAGELGILEVNGTQRASRGKRAWPRACVPSVDNTQKNHGGDNVVINQAMKHHNRWWRTDYRSSSTQDSYYPQQFGGVNLAYIRNKTELNCDENVQQTLHFLLV